MDNLCPICRSFLREFESGDGITFVKHFGQVATTMRVCNCCINSYIGENYRWSKLNYDDNDFGCRLCFLPIGYEGDQYILLSRRQRSNKLPNHTHLHFHFSCFEEAGGDFWTLYETYVST